MEHVIRQLDPQLVVMPHTYLVRDHAEASGTFWKITNQ